MASLSVPDKGLRLLNRLLRFVQRLLFVLPTRSLQLQPPPAACLYILQQTARPNVQRLEFRELFAQGRRYFFYPSQKQSFEMMTTRNKVGTYRRRIYSCSVILGAFDHENDNTYLHLQARMRIQYALRALLLPTFFSSIVIYMPWEQFVVAGIILGLYGFNWFGHRYHAALEAHAMMTFIRKALADHAPTPAPMLEQDGAADIVYDSQRQFQQAWEQFYEEKVHESL